MKQPDARILGIAPYEGLRIAMKKAAESYPQMHLDVYTGDLKDGVEIVHRLENEDYDAIISRGGTAEMISGITNLPVIPIQISVYDILRAIKMVEHYSKLYAIVGFSTITEPAHTVCDLLQYNLDIITVRNAEDIPGTLEQLRREGYRMIISDMISHTTAREMGFDAFLITSGTESICQAFEHALSISVNFRPLRRENRFLRAVAQESDCTAIILDKDGAAVFSTLPEPDPDLLSLFRSHIPEIPTHNALRIQHNQNGNLYQILARSLPHSFGQYYLFNYRSFQIPLRTKKSGMRILGEAECLHLFTNSFFSISGAMGELEPRLDSIASTRQPVMIIGEPGTGKEQIARILYLHSPLSKAPLAVIDCTLMADKSWDFLFNHDASPLGSNRCTLYFQHLESLPEPRCIELLSAITETNLIKRIRLLFSCDHIDGKPMPDPVRKISSRLGCLTLHLPTLRSRADEIPSLASLYLANLNMELGKQIIGFDPHATELLLHYSWPNNYTQFKQILTELATLATSSYIRGASVAEALARERAAYHASAGVSLTDGSRTLEQIILDIVKQTLDDCCGNQSAAAKQLGISRTTLWRYLNKK